MKLIRLTKKVGRLSVSLWFVSDCLGYWIYSNCFEEFTGTVGGPVCQVDLSALPLRIVTEEDVYKECSICLDVIQVGDEEVSGIRAGTEDLVDGVVGNSSSGLIEAPSLGTGTLNIGDRQRGRLKADSVIDCAPNRDAIQCP